MAWVGDSRAIVLTKRPQHTTWGPFQESTTLSPRMRPQDASAHGGRLASLAEGGLPARHPREQKSARNQQLLSSQGAEARSDDWGARLRGFSGDRGVTAIDTLRISCKVAASVVPCASSAEAQVQLCLQMAPPRT